MLDIKLLRENPKIVKDSQKKRAMSEDDVDRVLDFDSKWRKLKNEVDNLRAERNKISQEINQAKKSGDEKVAKVLIRKAGDIPKEIEYGKPLKLLQFKSNLTEEQIKKELFNFKFLAFVEKQDRDNETRYVLYFVYSKKRGMVFVITFREKIRIITLYPLGQNTLRKYNERKFKKDGTVK